jgi:hypothetical protein
METIEHEQRKHIEPSVLHPGVQARNREALPDRGTVDPRGGSGFRLGRTGSA